MEFQNFTWIKQDDGTLSITLVPPQAIGGRRVGFVITKRFGSEDYLIQKWANSGFSNVSGIQITDSGAGKFSVSLTGADTSGSTFDYGNYASKSFVETSGRRVTATEGYMKLVP